MHFEFQVLAAVTQEVGIGLEGEMGAHASQGDRRNDRLDDVIHRAQVEALLCIRDVCQTGQEDHRDVLRARIGLELAADFVAVHPGNRHVEQDQVGRRFVLCLAQRLVAAGGSRHLVMPAQQIAHHPQVARLVVGHQDGLLVGPVQNAVHGHAL
ncbi:hypothetical protein D3C81_1364850 [compost metagenome]